MSNVILLLTFADEEFATSAEQDCTVLSINMLENVGDDAWFRKNVKAEVVVISPELVETFVLLRIVFLWWRDILVLKDLPRLVIVLLDLILDLDPADAETNVWPNKRNSLINPPDNSHYMVVILSDDLGICLHLGIHRSERWLFLGDQVLVTSKTDESATSSVIVATRIIKVTEVKLHSKCHW